jgi:hypothetical protein
MPLNSKVVITEAGVHGHCWFAKEDFKKGEWIWKQRPAGQHAEDREQPGGAQCFASMIRMFSHATPRSLCRRRSHRRLPDVRADQRSPGRQEGEVAVARLPGRQQPHVRIRPGTRAALRGAHRQSHCDTAACRDRITPRSTLVLPPQAVHTLFHDATFLGGCVALILAQFFQLQDPLVLFFPSRHG